MTKRVRCSGLQQPRPGVWRTYGQVAEALQGGVAEFQTVIRMPMLMALEYAAAIQNTIRAAGRSSRNR